ncbi:MAG: NUDIX domain-containing protein [Candidatus Nanopelagicales bacterium]
MPPEGLPRPEESWSGPVVDTPDDSMVVSGRSEIFEGRVWSVVRDTVRMAGGDATRDVVIHPGAVAVIAVDEEDRVLLIRQYRHPVSMFLFEPPAGLLDVDGEPPLITAQRELLEEAGVQAARWHTLVDLFNSPGGSSEAIRVYLASELSAVVGGRPHTGEAEESYLPQAWVPLDEAVQLVLSGAIGSPSGVAGILALAAVRHGGGVGVRPADTPWRPREWLATHGRVRTDHRSSS